MSGDYTRVRYSAQSGYIGVLEQQGRVRLDADGNEQVESMDRRRRAESIDTIGHGVVPLTTKDGFLIQQPTAGQWTIGAGRAYVDGILVDCWGDGGSQAFQPDLGELRSPNPLPFAQQPFYYSPSFPLPPANASSIVYLDVWEREVTALEDPGLIDPALEGIDTTTRLQAAWQVKALPTTVDSCSDTPPDWQNLTAPSTGVLSTATTPAPASGSPCIIDPVAGYTGLENRLYRVQVSKSGTVDGATAAQYVWSSENAALGAVLLGIIGGLAGGKCQLAVSTVGRDRTFGFNVNDTLEVLDDFVEWSMRETKTGGLFVKVTSVDAEQLTITVTPDISSFAVVAGRHPRVRRWSAGPQPTQNGVALPLGTDGATVTFGPSPTATLRAGDYWVFYARTATGQVESLTNAPPRGVLHHYMKLAVVTTTQPIQDCRQFWPPPFGEGCCTVVVQVGDDIQKAIDSLPKQGGCVCLKTGVHPITRPIVIAGRTNISLHGESIGAVVQNSTPGRVLEIGDGERNVTDITVERITFLAAPSEGFIIQIYRATRCAVRECRLGLGTASAGPTSIIGFRAILANQLELRGNQVSDVIAALTATRCSNLVVDDNVFGGTTYTTTEGGPVLSGGYTAIDVLGPGGGVVSVRGNEITNFSQGVVVQTSGVAAQVAIEGNLVVRQGLVAGSAFDHDWSATDTDGNALGTLVQQKAYAIFTDVENAAVANNTINLADPGHGGILVAASGVAVCGNVVTSTVTVLKTYDWPSLPVGIVAYKPVLTASVDRCRIAENILNGPLKGIAVLAEANDATIFPAITGNRINTSGLTLASEQIDLTQLNLAQQQTTLDILWNDLTALNHAFGILLINADRAEVNQNAVSTCTAGIAALAWEIRYDTRLAETAFSSTTGSTFDGNDVDSSTIGILLEYIDSAAVLNGYLESNQAAIVLYLSNLAQVVGNRCSVSTVVDCLDLFGYFTRFEGNFLAGGATGLMAYMTEEVRFARNTVDTKTGTGIVVASCDGEICVEGNHLAYCGGLGQSAIEENVIGIVPGFAPTKGWQLDTPVAAGIAVLNCSGVITVDGCAVTETGQVAGSFCGDIIVVGGAHIRVRSCRVVRTQDSAHTSRALFLYPFTDQDDPAFTSTDASGNHIDVSHDPNQQNDFLAAEIRNQITGEIIASSDIIFVGNLVIQRKGATGRMWIVALTAESLAITGNRIRREFQTEAPSLDIKYNQGLSYVGNVVTGGARILPLIAASLELPSPGANYNVPR